MHLIARNDTPHSVGLLWTSDHPVAETSTWQHSTHNRQTSMPPAEFEPAISASEWPQTYALDRAVAGIGDLQFTGRKYLVPSRCCTAGHGACWYYVIPFIYFTRDCKWAYWTKLHTEFTKAFYNSKIFIYCRRRSTALPALNLTKRAEDPHDLQNSNTELRENIWSEKQLIQNRWYILWFWNYMFRPLLAIFRFLQFFKSSLFMLYVFPPCLQKLLH